MRDAFHNLKVLMLDTATAGVEEGRFAYDNVRKAIYLLISTGAAEVLMFIPENASALYAGDPRDRAGRVHPVADPAGHSHGGSVGDGCD